VTDNPLADFSITLDRVADVAPQEFKGAMGISLFDLLSIIKPYPQQPDRNRAKTFNTYVRGIGRVPKSAFFTAKGKARKKIRTKGVARTSQRLGQKWTSRVEVSGNTVTGTIENSASYANVVQGTWQPAFHADTGWVTYEDAYEQVKEQIDRNFNETLDLILLKLSRPIKEWNG